jgi:hypothetical protein
MSFHCFTPPFRQSVSRLLRFSQDNLLVIEDAENPQLIAQPDEQVFRSESRRANREMDKAKTKRKGYKEGRISGAYLSEFGITSDSASERSPNRLDLAGADRHQLAVRLNACTLGFSSRRHEKKRARCGISVDAGCGVSA